MCPICQQGQRLEAKLQTCRDRSQRKKIEEQLKQYRFHLDLAKRREAEYVEEINETKEGKCVICIDFKANISLGKGYENDSHVFFNAPQRTLIGAVGFFNLNGKKYKIIFSSISEVLNHDSLFVKEFVQKMNET